MFEHPLKFSKIVEHNLLADFNKIIVTGPTTLAAMLNSLQMGFKTLAIQKRSSEVWQVLGAVKTEFGKFGGVFRATSTLQEKYGLRIPVVTLPNGHEKGWPFTAAKIMRLRS